MEAESLSPKLAMQTMAECKMHHSEACNTDPVRSSVWREVRRLGQTVKFSFIINIANHSSIHWLTSQKPISANQITFFFFDFRKKVVYKVDLPCHVPVLTVLWNIIAQKPVKIFLLLLLLFIEKGLEFCWFTLTGSRHHVVGQNT